MTVENDGYVAYVAQKQPKATFRISFTDGTSVIRTVVSSSVVSASEELLTLNTTWPSNRTVSEIVMVEWLELVRLDVDDCVFKHAVIGRATTTIPAVVVRDAP